jgi:hypothetical protein
MVYLGLKALVSSQAALLPEVVLRETYFVPSCDSKEQAWPPQSEAMLHSAVVEAVTRTPPPWRVMQRWALADGVMQMAYLGRKALVRSEATLLREVVLRESYSVPSCSSKEQA